MEEKLSKEQFNAINAEICATFERIGRIVVYAERLRYQLLDTIAIAEIGPLRSTDRSPMSEEDWSALNKRLRKKFHNSPLPAAIERFEQSVLARYETDDASKAVVHEVTAQCRRLISERNDVTHSLWTIGWRVQDVQASSASFRFDRAEMALKDIELGHKMADMIVRFRTTISTVNGIFWGIFGGEALKHMPDPGPLFG